MCLQTIAFLLPWTLGNQLIPYWKSALVFACSQILLTVLSPTEKHLGTKGMAACVEHGQVQKPMLHARPLMTLQHGRRHEGLGLLAGGIARS